MKRRYRSPLMAAIHEMAEAAYKAGVMPKRTMRDFDERCLTPVKPLSPRKIRQLRLREKASQSVFAYHLGVSTNLISQWERGEKKPQGASLKLLTLVEKNGLDYVA
ncbi:MAG TPA: DNA-binding transcriptional regulator [Terriglobales bacterium]|nr:DNA-binding transcriptional regulator [Terriglobales bacterium]